MIISHKHKFIFIHSPKTAGCSVTVALLHSPNNLLAEEIKPRHIGAKNIRKLVTEEVFLKYHKFGCVRNPWDLQLSKYFFVRKHPQASPQLSKLAQGDFKTFIKNSKSIGSGFNNFKIEDEIVLDYIMKYESLQEDFNTVCDKIGIPRQELPHKNATEHKHYTEYYDDETRDIVSKFWARDIEYFGYEFGE